MPATVCQYHSPGIWDLRRFFTVAAREGAVNETERAQQYRRQAKRCAEAAEKAATEAEKAAWLRLAEEWVKTAITTETIEKRQRRG